MATLNETKTDVLERLEECMSIPYVDEYDAPEDVEDKATWAADANKRLDEARRAVMQEVLENFRDKCDAYAELILRKQAKADFFKKRKLDFGKKQSREEKDVEWLKSCVSNAMQEIGLDKMAGESYKYSFRKSETAEVDDIELVPMQFLRFKDPEADKTAIKKALKNGEEVPGAHLETKQNLQIK